MRIAEENNTNALWDILQMATSNICACAPLCKHVLPKDGHWLHSKLSAISLWASRTRSYWTLPDSRDSAQNSNNSKRQLNQGSSSDHEGAEHLSSTTKIGADDLLMTNTIRTYRASFGSNSNDVPLSSWDVERGK